MPLNWDKAGAGPLKKRKKVEEAADKFNLETPTQTTQPVQTTQPKEPSQRIFRSGETGRPSGITLPDGRTFLGLSPSEIETLAANELRKQGGPATQAFEKEGALQRDLAITEEQKRQAGQVSLGSPEQMQQNIPHGEGLVGKAATGGAALGGAVVGAKAGATTGATIGTAVAGPVGTAVGGVIGGVVGGIAGAVGGAYTKISFSERQDVKKAFKVFTTSKSNIDWIIDQTNAGRLSPSQAIDLWDIEISNIYAAERMLKEDTSTNLKSFLSNGGDELTALEAYKRRLPNKQTLLAAAILSPNPTAFQQSFNEVEINE
jgi:hypothetical protein